MIAEKINFIAESVSLIEVVDAKEIINKIEALKIEICKEQGKVSNSLSPISDKYILKIRDAVSDRYQTARDVELFYLYFKINQDILSGCSSKNIEYIVEFRDICRMLKWRYRASLCVIIKSKLDEILYEKLLYIKDGGGRDTSYQTSLQLCVLPSLGLNAGINIGLKNSLKSNAAEEIIEMSKLELGLSISENFERWCALNFGCSYTDISGKKFSKLEDYISHNSGNMRAWFEESKFLMFKNIKDISFIAQNYEKDLLFISYSESYCFALIKKHIAIVQKKEKTHFPGRVNFEGVSGFEVKAATGASFDFVVSLSSEFSCSYERLKKFKSMDIIELAKSNPELALKYIQNLPAESESELESEISSFIKKSSFDFYHIVKKPFNNSAILEYLNNCNATCKRFSERYVRLKLGNGKNTSGNVEKIFDENYIMLRPRKNYVYDMIAESAQTSAVINKKASASFFPIAEGEMDCAFIDINESDDVKMLGEYIDIGFSGEFKSTEMLAELIDTGLKSSGLKVSNIGVGKLVSAIPGLLIHHQQGSIVRCLFKYKGGEFFHIISQIFVTMKDIRKLGLPVPSILYLKGEQVSDYNILKNEVLGTETLDFILSVARKKITDQEWWGKYVSKHLESFEQLLKNISNLKQHTVLDSEVSGMSKEINKGGEVKDDLIKSCIDFEKKPTLITREKAIQSLNYFIEKYCAEYLNPRNEKNWKLKSN